MLNYAAQHAYKVKVAVGDDGGLFPKGKLTTLPWGDSLLSCSLSWPCVVELCVL